MLDRFDFRVCVFLGVDGVFYEEKKKPETCCDSRLGLVGLGAKIVCALATKLHRDAGYWAPSICSAWQGQLLVTMTSYIPSIV